MSLYKSFVAVAISLPFVVGAALAEPEQAAPGVEQEAAADPASNGETSPSSDESGAKAKEEKVADGDDKVVCKYVARTGTRFGSKVCATRKQWEQARKDSQESINDAQRRGSEYRTPS